MHKNMNNLILITPTKEHESQVMEFREEMLKNGEGFYGCSGLNSVSSYDDWLDFEGDLNVLVGLRLLHILVFVFPMVNLLE